MLNCIGLTLPLHELPSNISFESVLAKSHVDMLMQLAGCSGAQTRDPCDEKCFHSRYRLVIYTFVWFYLFQVYFKNCNYFWLPDFSSDFHVFNSQLLSFAFCGMYFFFWHVFWIFVLLIWFDFQKNLASIPIISTKWGFL